MNKRVILGLVLLALFTSLVAASDVAYIYKGSNAVDQNIVDVFEEMGFSVDTIQENKLSSTNFDNYKIIFVGDERFRNEDKIPITTKPSIIANYYHGEEFGLTDIDGISKLASNNPLAVRKDGRVIQVYTKAEYNLGGISIPYYYLDDENKVPQMMSVARTYTGMESTYDFGDVISYSKAGTELINGEIAREKICFFGIIESEFWTPAARELFKDCIGYVSVVCESDNECSSKEVGGEYCSTDDVYQDVENYVCLNPGQINSECVAEEIVSEKVDECGVSSNTSFGSNFCYSGDVYKSRMINSRGCSGDSCFSNSQEEKVKVEDCGTDSCYNGECVEIICYNDNDCDDSNDYTRDTCINPATPQSYCVNEPIECVRDSDCDSDYTGDNFCIGQDVYNELHDFSCVYGSCIENKKNKLVEECSDICVQGACQDITCFIDSDCGDSGFTGINYCSNDNSYQDFIEYTCVNPGQQNSYCTDSKRPVLQEYCDLSCVSGECVSCFASSECGTDGFVGGNYCIGDDVYRNYEDFTCSSPGTGSSQCNSDVNPVLVEECADSCVAGACVPIECSTDLECDDGSVYTIDSCVYPGTPSSYCTNVEVNCVSNSDCGSTGFYGTEFCSGDDVYKNYRESICQNAGTTQSYCEINNEPREVNSCGDDVVGSWGSNYCVGSEVYQKRIVTDKSCSQAICTQELIEETRLVETCSLGCFEGACTTGEHDVGFVEFDGSVDGILLEYLDGRDITGEVAVLSCEDTIKAKVSVENKGNFNENVYFVGSFNGVNISLSPILNSKPGNKDSRSTPSPHISLGGLEGYYDLEFNANIDSDSNLEDNVVIRRIEVVCGECKYYPVSGIGDVNLDGKITNLDQQLIVDYIFERTNFNAQQKVNADVNEDGSISVADVVRLTSHFLGTNPLPIVDGSLLNSEQCGDDFNSTNYCYNDDVYVDTHNFGCSVGDLCNEDVSKLKVEECGSDYCSDFGNNYCVGKDVYKSQTCYNSGCSEGGCFVEDNENSVLVQTCEDSCVNGACVPFECSTDLECDDGSVYTVDSCINPGTIDSYCTNVEVNCVVDSDCGSTGFTGNEFCSTDDVYKNFRNSTCINGGTIYSYCENSISPEKIVECGVDSVGSWSESYCSGDDVYRSREILDKGCSIDSCFSSSSTEEELIEACSFGCFEGSCVEPECTQNSECSFLDTSYCSENSEVYEVGVCTNNECVAIIDNEVDCGSDYCGEWGNDFCMEGDVYEIRTCYDQGCSVDSCYVEGSEESRLKEECNFGCSNGECNPGECLVDSDCESDYYGAEYCSNNGVNRDLHDFSCESYNCVEDVISEVVEDCGSDSCGELGVGYCIGSDVYKNQTCVDAGCYIDSCFEDETVNQIFIEECEYGCFDGVCGGFIPGNEEIDIMFVLDNSGSINETELIQLKNATNAIIDLLNPAENRSNIGVVHFNTEGHLDLTLSTDKEALKEVVNAIENTPNIGPNTHMQAGMLYGLNEFLGSNNRENVTDYMIIIGDGLANIFYSKYGTQIRNVDEIIDGLPGTLDDESSIGGLAFKATNETGKILKEDYDLTIFSIAVGLSEFIPNEQNTLYQVATSEAFYYDVEDYASLEEKLLSLVKV